MPFYSCKSSSLVIRLLMFLIFKKIVKLSIDKRCIHCFLFTLYIRSWYWTNFFTVDESNLWLRICTVVGGGRIKPLGHSNLQLLLAYCDLVFKITISDLRELHIPFLLRSYHSYLRSLFSSTPNTCLVVLGNLHFLS